MNITGMSYCRGSLLLAQLSVSIFECGDSSDSYPTLFIDELPALDLLLCHTVLASKGIKVDLVSTL